jgi:hypothetical protein
MPSVHTKARLRSSSRESSGGGSSKPLVIGLLLLVGCLSAFGAWWAGLFGRREDPRLTEVKGVMHDVAKQYPPTEGPKNMLDAAARVGAFITVAGKIRALPDDLRPKAIEEGMRIMMRSMETQMDRYFTTPPEKRDQFLDDQLKQFQSMAKAFEGSQSMFQGMGGRGGEGGGGGGNAGGAPKQASGGGGPRSEGDRERFRKAMLDRSSPSQRARWNEFFGALDRRRQQTGTSGGSPFAPR